MAGGGQRRHYNVTLAILSFCGLTYALAQTLVVPSLPTIQADMHAANTWATWVLSSFLLAASVATPMLGRLGDQFGKERLMVVALVMFLLGCIGAAAAWNIWSLIAFRTLQGGAGAVFPLAFGIIRDEFPSDKVAVGIGTISSIFGVGGGAGILLAGVIVDHASWRWLFVGAAAVTAVAIVLVLAYVPESPIRTPSRVDYLGAALLTAGLVCLLVALTEGNRWGWLSGRTLAVFAASALFLLLLGRWELHTPDPLVDMRMLAGRTVLVANAAALVSGFSLFGTFVLIPAIAETPHGVPAATARLVHYGFDASVTKAGLYLLPSPAAMLFAGPLAGALGRRIGMKWPLSSGLVAAGLGCAGFAVWHDHPWQVAIAAGVMGVGAGFAFASMATLVTQAVRPSETGVATGVNTVMRTIGSVIGAQLAAALLATYTIGGTHVPSITGFDISFWISAGVAIVAGLAGFFVAPPHPRRTRLALAGAGGTE